MKYDNLTPVFDGDFRSQEDVFREFQVRDADKAKVHRVLYAWYDGGGYDGEARVVYVGTDGELYETTGSHCSCFGLEDQWTPVCVTPESLAMYKKELYEYKEPHWASFVASLTAQEQNMEHEYGYGIRVQGELVISVDGDYDTYESFEQACGDAFQDEFGVRPNPDEDGDALMDIVAVPDDVAELVPAPGTFVVLACSTLLATLDEVPE